MLGQLKIVSTDGVIRDKVECAIERLKAFEPKEGYYVAFSGGKDSQCVYHLCKMAGVKFDAHYNVTSVDPPELIRFIKKNYPDVIWDYPRDKDGNVITMWNLIERKNIPPTRMARYCCEHLKESSGKGRVTVTGVRWAESQRRAKNHGVATFTGKRKGTEKAAEEIGAEYKISASGGVILNDDNDAARRMVEHCYRTQKTLVNPIVDWEEEDVWEFLNENGIEHCSLYDEGYTRLGCIGCPLGGKNHMERNFKRYPKYKENYIKAFNRMLEANKKKGIENSWKNADEVMQWWLNGG
jgi:phosphoadenosine phosphosulfate reductase